MNCPCMSPIITMSSTVAEAVPEEGQCGPMGPPVINSTMAETRIQRMTESVSRRLGLTVFQRVYNYLKGARERQEDEGSIRQALSSLVERPVMALK
ncbi:serine/threonine-protein kinase Nek11-like [Salvelinus sp. IW2-2015]|uniref:serine/threonine-protein kinase Nek11-like n=1 Tax=Salvelinus sp. IW2-2015 TaxID=2691554 RepID=UPI000CEAF746|nr:serine/threonine-protein kinase Nek11-like [Salvelinus alpinus]